MKNEHAIHYYHARIIKCNSFIDQCIKEREKFLKDKKNYKPENAPVDLIDSCRINYDNYQSGLNPGLFHNVEQIRLNDYCKLSKILGLDENKPFEPFINEFLKNNPPPKKLYKHWLRVNCKLKGAIGAPSNRDVYFISLDSGNDDKQFRDYDNFLSLYNRYDHIYVIRHIKSEELL